MGVCKRLIDRANEAGGPDNITVIAARFEGSRLQPPATDDEVGHRVFPMPETGQTPAVTAEIPQVTPPERRTTRPIPVEDVDPETVTAAADIAHRHSPPNGTAASTTASASATPAEAAPAVSPARRTQGMIVAVILFTALVVGGIWFVFQAAQKVKPVVRPADSIRTTDSIRTDTANADAIRRADSAVRADLARHQDSVRRADSIRSDSARIRRDSARLRSDSTRRDTTLPPAR